MVAAKKRKRRRPDNLVAQLTQLVSCFTALLPVRLVLTISFLEQIEGEGGERMSEH